MGSLQTVARWPVGITAEQGQIGICTGDDPAGAGQGRCRSAHGFKSEQ